MYTNAYFMIIINPMGIMYVHIKSTKHYKIICMSAWMHTESTHSSYPRIGRKVNYQRQFMVMLTCRIHKAYGHINTIVRYTVMYSNVHAVCKLQKSNSINFSVI